MAAHNQSCCLVCMQSADVSLHLLLALLLLMAILSQALQPPDRHVSMQSFQHHKSTVPQSHEPVFEFKTGM